MKLYDFELAPNAQRVRVFLAEKGSPGPTTLEEPNMYDQVIRDGFAIDGTECR